MKKIVSVSREFNIRKEQLEKLILSYASKTENFESADRVYVSFPMNDSYTLEKASVFAVRSRVENGSFFEQTVTETKETPFSRTQVENLIKEAVLAETGVEVSSFVFSGFEEDDGLPEPEYELSSVKCWSKESK